MFTVSERIACDKKQDLLKRRGDPVVPCSCFSVLSMHPCPYVRIESDFCASQLQDVEIIQLCTTRRDLFGKILFTD